MKAQKNLRKQSPLSLQHKPASRNRENNFLFTERKMKKRREEKKRKKKRALEEKENQGHNMPSSSRKKQKNTSISITISRRLTVDQKVKKTKYGKQLCSIGALIETTPNGLLQQECVEPVVVRGVRNAAEFEPPYSGDLHLLTPCMRYRDEKTNDLFVVYNRFVNERYKFEMTLDWYMKVHKMNRSNGLLSGGIAIQPALILRPDNKFTFSKTFKEFLRSVVCKVGMLHEMACTNGRLCANNIIVMSTPFGRTMYDSDYEITLVNCLKKHDLEKEEEKKSFESRVKKDWNGIHKLILDATNGLEESLDYELTHFLKKLKKKKKKGKLLNFASFNHPALWSPANKHKCVRKLSFKDITKKLEKLGFLKGGKDWRKLIHEDILATCQEEALYWMGWYREDYDGKFNDSLEDLICFFKDTCDSFECGMYIRALESMGYESMDVYLSVLFPDFFVKLYRLGEGKTTAFHADWKDFD